MSGGVDSSVAASLLQAQGYDLVGLFMRHGEESSTACELELDDRPSSRNLPVVQARSDHKQGCCSASDAMDARRIADQLNIPFYALDMQSDFRRIVDYFVEEYRKGRTPNPCVQCNNWIKFGALFDYADAVDAHYVATGHYAQLLSTDEGVGPADDSLGIYRGIDSRKDQSYVLAGINQKYLSRMLLPIGGYEKPRIRELAAGLGMKVADKRDSQEICFVTSGHHGDFVRDRTEPRSSNQAGAIVTSDGKRVGEHSGIENFTIGQRKGLGVGMSEPYFVVDLDVEQNAVIIGKRSELARTNLIASGCNWLCDDDTLAENLAGDDVSVQIRYNSSSHRAKVDRIESNQMRVQFDSAVDSVAPGQLAVVYRGNRVLGGGWIGSAK